MFRRLNSRCSTIRRESQIADVKIFYGVSDWYGDQLVQALRSTGMYRLAFNYEGSMVLARTAPAEKNVQGSGGGTG